jgi:HNH endonuclease
MLTQELVRDLFDLDSDSGILYWKVPKSGIRVGDVAGCKKSGGYWVVKIAKRDYKRSRINFLYVNGWLPAEVDHRDTDRLNDRPSNLRPADRSEQNANTRGRSNGLPKGVYIDPRRSTNPYRASIGYKKKRINLGSFQTPEAAHDAYCVAANSYFGAYARCA